MVFSVVRGSDAYVASLVGIGMNSHASYGGCLQFPQPAMAVAWSFCKTEKS